jgi:hypothetical protein
MRKSPLMFIASLLSFLCLLSAKQPVCADPTLLYEKLKQSTVDPSKIAVVNDVVFHRDVGNFHLHQGEIFFFQPVSVSGTPRVTGAIFVGQGSFSFTPPTQIEREQLARFYKEESFEQEYKVLFLRFADSTFRELDLKLSLGPGAVPKEVDKEKAYCEKYILDELNEDIVFSLLDDLVREG